MPVQDVTGYSNDNYAHDAWDANMGRSDVKYPKMVAHRATVTEITKLFGPRRFSSDVQTLNNFTNRSQSIGYTKDAANWLFTQVLRTTKGTQAMVTMFEYKDPRVRYIIAKVPGRSANTIVIGVHQNPVDVRMANSSSANDDDLGLLELVSAI